MFIDLFAGSGEFIDKVILESYLLDDMLDNIPYHLSKIAGEYIKKIFTVGRR